jgi:plastocyanin
MTLQTRRINRFAAGAILVAAVIALTSCGGYGGGSKSKSSESASGGEQSTTDVSGTGSTEVELDDNYFKPNVLTGKPGEKLTLELKNEGKVEHNFTVDGQSIDQDVAAGKDASVSVTLPQSGTLAFYCKYHKSSGMTGELRSGGSGSAGGGGSTGKTDTSGGMSY